MKQKMYGKKKAKKVIEIKKVTIKEKDNKDVKEKEEIPNDIFAKVSANTSHDENVWLKYNFENVTTQKPPEKAVEVSEEEEGEIIEKKLEKVGDCNGASTSKSQGKEYCNLNEFRGHEIEPEEIMPMTPPRILRAQELESSQSESDGSEYQPLESGWDKNKFLAEEKKSIAIVVDKIKTKAMCYATTMKLNVFAVLINDCQQQFLVKVEKLNSTSDVLIRAGKIHFRESSGITVEEIDKEDGHYKRCRYKVVAKFQEIKDEFDKGKINLVMLPITARDENCMNPSFISRKCFMDKAKLYKNCKILPFTIARKLINQYSKKTLDNIKLEPNAETSQTMGLLCELDNIDTKEELQEKENKKKMETLVQKPKTKRAYKRKQPGTTNAKKSQSNPRSKAGKTENLKFKPPATTATDKKVDQVELAQDKLLQDIMNNQIETEVEVKTTTTRSAAADDKEKENNNKVNNKPGPKSKRQMQARRIGPGRQSMRRNQVKNDDNNTNIETDMMVKIEQDMSALFDVQEEIEIESTPAIPAPATVTKKTRKRSRKIKKETSDSTSTELLQVNAINNDNDNLFA